MISFFFFCLQMFKKPQTCIRAHNLVAFRIAGGVLLGARLPWKRQQLAYRRAGLRGAALPNRGDSQNQRMVMITPCCPARCFCSCQWHLGRGGEHPNPAGSWGSEEPQQQGGRCEAVIPSLGGGSLPCELLCWRSSAEKS